MTLKIIESDWKYLEYVIFIFTCIFKKWYINIQKYKKYIPSLRTIFKLLLELLLCMIQQTLFVLSLLYILSLLKIKIVLKDYVGDKYRFWNIWTVNINPLIYNARTYTVSMSISQTFSPAHHVNKKKRMLIFLYENQNK